MVKVVRLVTCGGRSPVFPLFLIVIGIVLLLNNYGLITVNIWDLLATYWPVLLILYGLSLLSGCGHRGVAWWILILVLILFALFAYMAPMRSWHI
ncbi:MAG: hypothetical protein HPY52_10425 [Firmicutes bacterium]|nr:hypothetical protein [Bacillota bacterium]